VTSPMGPRGARIYELSEMCVRLTSSCFPVVTSCKPNAQVMGFRTDWDISVIVHCNSAQSVGHVPSTSKAKRKRNKVTTTGISTCCISKITSRISGMYPSQRLRGPKAWVCGNSLVENAGSNPAGGMDVCV